VSEEEGFLNRWSRRKQETAKESAAEQAAKAETDEASAAPADTGAAQTPAEEPEFDISTLPPVESITAGTDIRAFLSKGVPAALTQAALRRAWSADPAIRDYVGLSEYSWDFNASGQYGFGPLDPSLNVQEMVADMFGKVKEAVVNSEAPGDNADAHEAPVANAVPQEESPTQSVELRSAPRENDSSPVPATDKSEPEAGDKSAQHARATQQIADEPEGITPPPRRHGSALPT
jgi:hypothetical protein